MVYSEESKKVLFDAGKYASEDDGILGSEHLLLAICKDGSTLAALTLRDHGVTAEKVGEYINYGMPRATIVYSNRVKWILRSAAQDAENDCSSEITAEHILLAIFELTDCVAMRIIRHLGADYKSLKLELCESMRINRETQDVQEDIELVRRAFGELMEDETELSPKALDIGIDMIAKAASGVYDPVISRDDEIERVIEILLRRNKNSPLLLGEAGVGKTAIVEGLAQRIADGNVPNALRDKRLISLNMASLVAGTRYRGDFEEKLSAIIQEATENDDTIIFIDELHTIVGAGSAEGSQDVANILKPVLARGELRVIGATTPAEYKKYIEQDRALQRRFQTVSVSAPSARQTVDIIKGIRDKYVEHHGVELPTDVIESAVYLSEKYITDRNLPDKAIDLIDESMSRKSIRGKGSENNILTIEDVRETLGRMTAKDVSVFDDTIDGERDIEKGLNELVYGQRKASMMIDKAITRYRAGIRESGRPIGVFIFYGADGVGKRTMARALAKVYYGDERSVIELDMNEYSERAAISALIGTSSGYVGYEEGGKLVDALRRKPYSVLLFENIDKADDEVKALIRCMCKDGYVEDRKGNVGICRNTFVVMTLSVDSKGIGGFAQSNSHIALPKELQQYFADVCDAEIFFDMPDSEALKNIVKRRFAELTARINEKGRRLMIDEGVADNIVERNPNVVNASGILKVVDWDVETPLASYLSRRRSPGNICIKVRQGKIVIEDDNGCDG